MTTTNIAHRLSSFEKLIAGGESAAPPGRRLSHGQIVDISMALDALIVFGACVSGQLVYPFVWSGTLSTDATYTLVGIITGLVHYVVTRARMGRLKQLRPNSLRLTLQSLLLSFAVVIAVGYLLKQTDLHSRLWLGIAFIIAFASIGVKNGILQLLLSRSMLRDHFVERVALFGDPAIASSLRATLEAEGQGYCSVTIYDGGGDALSDPAGMSDQLGRLIADGLDNKFERVVICLAPDQLDRIGQVLASVKVLAARIEACVGHAELRAVHEQVLKAPSEILINIDDCPQDAWGRFMKRAMDLLLGTVLLAVSVPVLAGAAIAIKLDSRGPVFFRQRRHGWNHSVICVWKLRTMTVQEDGGSVVQAVRNDPRVTRVGKFLRKTSIDELPQLLNVLSGEMSLVGPRPHALAHNMHYTQHIASYAWRHRVKPGLTGWAQVQGLRGNSEDISKMIARAEADIWYIRNWSIWLDLKILLKTPLALLLARNAV